MFLRCRQAQVALEFTFCMIGILLLIYGCVMIFRWAGVNLADQAIMHDTTLTRDVHDTYDSSRTGPLSQVSIDFYIPSKLNFVFRQW